MKTKTRLAILLAGAAVVAFGQIPMATFQDAPLTVTVVGPYAACSIQAVRGFCVDNGQQIVWVYAETSDLATTGFESQLFYRLPNGNEEGFTQNTEATPALPGYAKRYGSMAFLVPSGAVILRVQVNSVAIHQKGTFTL